MTKVLHALGMMSGTSADGIDVAHLWSDGHVVQKFGQAKTYPYPKDFRQKILAQLGKKPPLVELEKELTDFHIKAAKKFIKEFDLKDIDVIGFHGHTITHKPREKFTYQIGDGQALANALKVQVVYDFRSNDVEHGGQGAPLVPIYHQVIAKTKNLAEPVAFLNLGGVANITYMDEDLLMAFDTGPANALIDDWVHHHTDQAFDHDGKIAAQGKVPHHLISEAKKHPYFQIRPPKSLDRQSFKDWAMNLCQGLSLNDGAAFLTELTALCVQQAFKWLPDNPTRLILCGGGRLNHYLCQRMSALCEVEVLPIDKLGLDGDAIEAQAFALLAVRSLYHLPISWPETTGVPAALSGGCVRQPS